MTISIPLLSNLSERPAAQAWLCDIWGVLHNGKSAFEGAKAATAAFRKSGGIVVLVSNAPRPASVVAKHLQTFGITEASYDAIVTSGDVTRSMMQARKPVPFLHVGPDRDHGIFAGLDWPETDAANAELLLCSGLEDDQLEQPDNYRDLFVDLVGRGIPMICANPDIKVERGHEVIYCAGALAELYASLGGDVTYAGKPHKPVYDTALAAIAKLAGREIARDRVLAIGDGINTDIRGAAGAGIPSLFIASAIHVDGPLSRAKLDALFAPLPFRPAAAMDALVF